MNTIAKKTLSLVFAGTMALTSLTVGSVSALAAGASDYKAVTEGVTTVDSTKVAFTPATTAYYNISFAKSVNNKSASSNYDNPDLVVHNPVPAKLQPLPHELS